MGVNRGRREETVGVRDRVRDRVRVRARTTESCSPYGTQPCTSHSGQSPAYSTQACSLCIQSCSLTLYRTLPSPVGQQQGRLTACVALQRSGETVDHF